MRTDTAINFGHTHRLRLWSLMLGLAVSAASALAAGPYPDRFVWVFGWNLNKDADVAAVSQVLEAASQHGLNGAVVSFGLDTDRKSVV